MCRTAKSRRKTYRTFSSPSGTRCRPLSCTCCRKSTQPPSLRHRFRSVAFDLMQKLRRQLIKMLQRLRRRRQLRVARILYWIFDRQPAPSKVRTVLFRGQMVCQAGISDGCLLTDSTLKPHQGRFNRARQVAPQTPDLDGEFVNQKHPENNRRLPNALHDRRLASQNACR